MRKLAQELKKAPIAEDVAVDAVQHDILRPALVVTPNWEQIHSDAATASSSS